MNHIVRSGLLDVVGTRPSRWSLVFSVLVLAGIAAVRAYLPLLCFASFFVSGCRRPAAPATHTRGQARAAVSCSRSTCTTAVTRRGGTTIASRHPRDRTAGRGHRARAGHPRRHDTMPTRAVHVLTSGWAAGLLLVGTWGCRCPCPAPGGGERRERRQKIKSTNSDVSGRHGTACVVMTPRRMLSRRADVGRRCSSASTVQRCIACLSPFRSIVRQSDFFRHLSTRLVLDSARLPHFFRQQTLIRRTQPGRPRREPPLLTTGSASWGVTWHRAGLPFRPGHVTQPPAPRVLVTARA